MAKQAEEIASGGNDCIVVGAWAGMAQTTVALTAGLKGIPIELHEAAASDGATTWQRFRHITWPQLRPGDWVFRVSLFTQFFHSFLESKSPHGHC